MLYAISRHYLTNKARNQKIMKKVITIAAVALLGAIVLPSCKKDYTCTCTIQGQSVSYTYNKVKKSDAKTSCDQQNTAASILGGSCSLN